MSLADYAKKGCPVCELSDELQQEMMTGYSQGIRYKAMATWLEVEHSTSVSVRKIENHFQKEHHAKKS